MRANAKQSSLLFNFNFVAGCKKHAFTLAEVLITLSIIGVVAAMTMPSLIQSSRKQEASARLKKFSSAMSQAILFAENEYGTPAYEWTDINNFKNEDGIVETQVSFDATYAYWNKYFAPYMQCLKVEAGIIDEEDPDKTRGTIIYFSDGSTAVLHFGSCIDLRFDTNGDRKPNEFGKDMFTFFIATEDSHKKNPEHELFRNNSFATPYLPVYNTREKALNACKNNNYVCSTLLQYDNFEFKDDYPYRL